MARISFFATPLKAADVIAAAVVYWGAGGSFSWNAQDTPMQRTAIIAGILAGAFSVLARAIDTLSGRVYHLEHPGEPDGGEENGE